MPDLESIGRWLVIAGLGLVVFGALFWVLARVFPNLSQFPGTIRFQTGGLTCVFPLLASILLSLILTIVLNIASRIK